jgi:hypothetical protein
MKTAHQLTIVAALVAGAIATQPSFAQPQAQDAARAQATEQRQLAPFSAIELAGPYRVIVDAQSRQSLTLSGPRKDLAEIETVVRGDTLVVRPVARTGNFFSFGKHCEPVTIHINAASLNRLAMSGSGDVALTHAGGDALILEDRGSGDLQASGAVRRLRVSGSGSGDIDLRGLKAADVDVAMHGSGEIGLGAVGATLALELHGSGGLQADSVQAQSARLRMDGSGDVTLRGTVGDLTAELRGSGALEADALTVRTATVRSHSSGSVTLAQVGAQLDAELHGSGDLEAKLAAQRLRLQVDGSGDAHLDGSVARIEAQLTGSGSLEGSGLTAGHADIAVRGSGTANVQLKDGAAPARLLLVDRRGTRNAVD